MTYCPNCGSDELVSKLEIRDEESGEVLETHEPDGGILVCARCHIAVDPNEGSDEPEPAPEEGPEPVEPERPEDEPLFDGDEG